MKFWVKTISNSRVIKNKLYETTLDLTYPSYEIILREIAELLDVPTPLYLKSQFRQLRSFGLLKFKSIDFVESIDFDSLEIERVKETKSQNPINDQS